MFRCFVVASPQSLWFLNLKAALFCRPIPRKMLCRQMITFMQILNGQMSAAYCVADCSSLPAGLSTACCCWKLIDVRQPKATRSHCNVMRPWAGVRDGLCFHRRSSETVRKKVRRPFKKKYFGKHVYQTNVVGRCAVTILLPILDLNFVCVCLLHCTCILVKLCFKM